MGTISIFGDVKHTNSLARLEGETLITVFGDLDLDFIQRPLAPGEHNMRVTTVFGEVKLRFPEGVAVHVEGFTLFGNIQVGQTEDFEAAPVRLHLHVVSIFGDINVVHSPATSALAYDGQTRNLTNDHDH